MWAERRFNGGEILGVWSGAGERGGVGQWGVKTWALALSFAFERGLLRGSIDVRGSRGSLCGDR